VREEWPKFQDATNDLIMKMTFFLSSVDALDVELLLDGSAQSVLHIEACNEKIIL
jgi:hypothetical protein